MAGRRRRNSATSYADVVLALSPVSYWRFDESSGTVARDQKGFRNATYTNTPTLGVVGVVPGTAVTFTRASSEHATTASVCQTVIDNWTMAAWVLPSTSATTRCIMYNGATNNGYGLFLNSTHQGWGFSEGVTHLVDPATGTTALSTTAWSHVVLLRRGGTSRLYLNGKLDKVGGTTTPLTPTASTSIGAENGAAHFFDGSIDDPAIWDRALTDGEVAELYAARW